MSYLICEKCGKQYKLAEGKSSFNFEKCECSGKLRYSPSIKKDTQLKPVKTSNKNKLKGVIIGFIFLFISLSVSIMALFGTNISLNNLNVSSNVLTIFTIISVILIVVSGTISSYISGSRRFLEAAINGGLVGVILGLIIGSIGGFFILLSGVLVFGFLSMIGGVFSSYIRRKKV